MAKAKGAGDTQQPQEQPGFIQRSFPPLQSASIFFIALKILKQGNKTISYTTSVCCIRATITIT